MNSKTYAAKSLVNSWLRRLGYRIERIADVTENRVDVFWLALRLAMARAGSEFFFVQIGAHNGADDDPIHEFVVRYHPSGVLIEPQPLVFLELKKNYASEPQLIFENVAISHDDGEAKMYYPKAENGEPTSVLTTFRREVLEYQIGRGAKIEEINVATRTFQTLFTRHFIRRVDLLQIDAEGFDCEILKLFDFRAYKPMIVRFEHIHLSRRELTEAVTLLANLGYQFYRDTIDLVAIRNE
jgi:FkbM family methyltransferase